MDEELERRIKTAESHVESNCTGSGLFLARLKDKDETDYRPEIPELGKYLLVTEPGNGQLLVVESIEHYMGEFQKTVRHIAYLFEQDEKLKVAERVGDKQGFEVGDFPSPNVLRLLRDIRERGIIPLAIDAQVTLYQIN